MSVLSFGAWQIGDPKYWGDDGADDAGAAVGAAIDTGINLFDTAEQYGNGESERVLGKALGARREEVYVASKVSPENCNALKLRQSCERSLQNLGTDRLDLYQIHWPFRGIAFEDVFAELKHLQREGKIRHIGVSNFGPADLKQAHRRGEICSNQIGYNLLFRAPEYEIVPACQRMDVGVLAYMPLMQGLLSGRWMAADDVPQNRRRTRHFSKERPGTRHGEEGCEDLVFQALAGIAKIAKELGETMATVALAWLIAQPGVTSAIVGARKPEQLERNLRAAELTLHAGVIEELGAITHPIKVHLGHNADMWQGEGDSRIQ